MVSPHEPSTARDYEGAVTRTATRYARRTSGPTLHYVRSKLRTDPSARAIAERAPLGDLLDLGCGRGQLAVLLLEAAAADRVVGVDWDAEKVAAAERASVGLEARFLVGDVRTAEVAAADTVLLVDVLHYLAPAEQDALLARAAGLVRPGGRLVVRDASTRHGWRSTLTLLAERIGTAAGVNRGERVVFRDVERDLVDVVEREGLRCEVEPCWGSTPFSNVLLVARRP